MRKLFVLAALAGVFALVASVSAFAGHGDGEPEVTPGFVLGNPSCEGGLKIEPVTSGTYNADFGGFAGTITIVVSGSSFSFDTDHDSHVVTSVLVKGGPNANLYNYGAGIPHDDGLTAPINPNNGKPFGLSHLCFFTDKL